MYEGILESLNNSRVQEINGLSYVIHPITTASSPCDAKMIDEIATWMKSVMIHNINLILVPETMGIPFAVLLSQKTGIPYTIIRKTSFNQEGEIEFIQRNSYSKTTLYINGIKPGMRLLLVDDLIFTGGTVNSIISQVKDKGAEVAQVIVALNKNSGVEKFSEQIDVKVKALFDINIEKDSVHSSISSFSGPN